MLRRPTLTLCATIAALTLAFTQIAPASSIPTLSEGEHVLVAVEPLLASMQIAYSLNAGHLVVGDHAYIGPMVIDAGLHYAEPRAIASFLNLSIVDENGVMTFAPPAPHSGAGSTAPHADVMRSLQNRLLDLLNAHRAAAGLRPLSVDSTASSAAEMQAEDMGTVGIMRHTDSEGRSPFQRFKSIGGHATLYGENVAYYGLQVSDEENLWIAIDKLDAMMMAEQPPDDGHRRAILNPAFRSVGFGVASGSNGIYLAEDFFAR
jgi:uncharacterized protein YkwD